MSKCVYVVTCVELGWDCVVGVYDNIEAANTCKGDDDTYIIHDQYLESKCED